MLAILFAIWSTNNISWCLTELEKFDISKDIITYIIKNTDPFILKNGYNVHPVLRICDSIIDQSGFRNHGILWSTQQLIKNSDLITHNEIYTKCNIIISNNFRISRQAISRLLNEIAYSFKV